MAAPRRLRPTRPCDLHEENAAAIVDEERTSVAWGRPNETVPVRSAAAARGASTKGEGGSSIPFDASAAQPPGRTVRALLLPPFKAYACRFSSICAFAQLELLRVCT